MFWGARDFAHRSTFPSIFYFEIPWRKGVHQGPYTPQEVLHPPFTGIPEAVAVVGQGLLRAKYREMLVLTAVPSLLALHPCTSVILGDHHHPA